MLSEVEVQKAGWLSNRSLVIVAYMWWERVFRERGRKCLELTDQADLGFEPVS